MERVMGYPLYGKSAENIGKIVYGHLSEITRMPFIYEVIWRDFINPNIEIPQTSLPLEKKEAILKAQINKTKLMEGVAWAMFGGAIFAVSSLFLAENEINTTKDFFAIAQGILGVPTIISSPHAIGFHRWNRKKLKNLILK